CNIGKTGGARCGTHSEHCAQIGHHGVEAGSDDERQYLRESGCDIDEVEGIVAVALESYRCAVGETEVAHDPRGEILKLGVLDRAEGNGIARATTEFDDGQAQDGHAVVADEYFDEVAFAA